MTETTAALFSFKLEYTRERILSQGRGHIECYEETDEDKYYYGISGGTW